MSIIYKALQKTQQGRQSLQSGKVHAVRERDWVLITLMSISTILLLIIVCGYMPKLKTLHWPWESATQVAVKKPVVMKHYVLNGVFFSENSAIAMVNNQYLNLGDKIDDMQVVQISDNSVRLEGQGRALDLTVPV